MAAHRQRSQGRLIGALAGQLRLIVCRADHQVEGADGLLLLAVLLPRTDKILSVLKKQMMSVPGVVGFFLRGGLTVH